MEVYNKRFTTRYYRRNEKVFITILSEVSSISDLYILTHGTRISKKGRLLKIRTPVEYKAYKTEYVSPLNFDRLVLDCQAVISTAAIELIMKHEKSITIQKFDDMYQIVNSRSKIPEIWKKQISLKKVRKRRIAKNMVRAGIRNKISMIKLVNTENYFDESITFLEGQIKKIRDLKSVPSILGIEGNATRKYFEVFAKWLPKEFGFKGRKKYPSGDPINSVLSYGYVVLVNNIERKIVEKGLNPYQGIYHKTYRNRKSLAFDIIEEFRQPVIDYILIKMVKKREIKVKDFEKKGKRCRIKNNLKKKYVSKIYQRLKERENYVKRGKKKEGEVKMGEIIDNQIEQLINAITKREKYKGFVIQEV